MEESGPMFNWLAHIVAVVVMQVIGMIWYNQKVLGNAWMRETGLNMGEGRSMGYLVGVTTVLAFLVTIPLSFMVKHGGAEFATFKHGAFHGMQFGIMVALPIIATGALYENRSWKYIGIAAGYWTLGAAAMGAILCGWQ